MVNKCKFERPKPGDIFKRYDTVGRLEEAQVCSVIGHPDDPEDWKAIMFTGQGHESFTSDAEFRGKHDWAPAAWDFNELTKAWSDPNSTKKVEIPAPYVGEHWRSWRSRAVETVAELRAHPNASDLLAKAWKEMDKVPAPEETAAA